MKIAASAVPIDKTFTQLDHKGKFLRVLHRITDDGLLSLECRCVVNIAAIGDFGQDIVFIDAREMVEV